MSDQMEVWGTGNKIAILKKASASDRAENIIESGAFKGTDFAVYVVKG